MTRIKKRTNKNLASAVIEKRLQCSMVQRLRYQYAIAQAQLGEMMTAHQEQKFANAKLKERKTGETVRGISID